MNGHAPRPPAPQGPLPQATLERQWFGPVVVNMFGAAAAVDKIFRAVPRITPQQVMAEAVALLDACERGRVSPSTFRSVLQTMVNGRLTPAQRIELAGHMLHSPEQCSPKLLDTALATLITAEKGTDAQAVANMEEQARGMLLARPCVTAEDQIRRGVALNAYATVFKSFGAERLACQFLTHTDQQSARMPLKDALALRTMALDALRVPAQSPALIRRVTEFLDERDRSTSPARSISEDAHRRLIECCSLAYARVPANATSAERTALLAHGSQEIPKLLTTAKASSAQAARLIGLLDTDLEARPVMHREGHVPAAGMRATDPHLQALMGSHRVERGQRTLGREAINRSQNERFELARHLGATLGPGRRAQVLLDELARKLHPQILSELMAGMFAGRYQEFAALAAQVFDIDSLDQAAVDRATQFQSAFAGVASRMGFSAQQLSQFVDLREAFFAEAQRQNLLVPMDGAAQPARQTTGGGSAAGRVKSSAAPSAVSTPASAGAGPAPQASASAASSAAPSASRPAQPSSAGASPAVSSARSSSGPSAGQSAEQSAGPSAGPSPAAPPNPSPEE